MKKSCGIVVLGFASLGSLINGLVFADDDEQEERRVSRRIRIERTGENKYWLGIMLAPVGDTLKSQLDIEGGVAVEKVIDDSPADTAGLQRHDVVTKLGERDVTSIKDLLEAVRENKDQENTVTVLRKGRTRTLQIQPTEAPARKLSLTDEDGETDVRAYIQRWLDTKGDKTNGQPFRMRFFGPGVIANRYELELSKMPEDLSITV